jgi:hypothetical protein
VCRGTLVRREFLPSVPPNFSVLTFIIILVET